MKLNEILWNACQNYAANLGFRLDQEAFGAWNRPGLTTSPLPVLCDRCAEKMVNAAGDANMRNRAAEEQERLEIEAADNE